MWLFQTDELNEELLGAILPGRQPVVGFDKGFPEEVVLAHEYGHKTLCTGTSLGRYQICLAIAAFESTNPAIRSRAMTHLRSTITDCWAVHEGFATAWQIAECMTIREHHHIARQVEKALRDDYRSALEQFKIPTDYLDFLLKEPCAFEYDSGLLEPFTSDESHFPRIVAMVQIAIAVAALSIPLKEILEKSSSLPDLDVLAQIRSHSPEVRLAKIVNHLHSNREDFQKLIRTVTYNRVILYNKRGISGKTPAVAADLCSMAGIPFESPDEFPNDVTLKMDVDSTFNVEDVSSRERGAIGSGLVVLSHPIVPLGNKPFVQVMEIQDIHNQQCGIAHAHCICEVVPADNAGTTICSIELFSFVREESGAARLIDFQSFFVPPSKLLDLPQLFQHSNWSWLTTFEVIMALGFKTKDLKPGRVCIPTNNLDALENITMYRINCSDESATNPPPSVSNIPLPPPSRTCFAVFENPVTEFSPAATSHVSFVLPLYDSNLVIHNEFEFSAIACAMFWGRISANTAGIA